MTDAARRTELADKLRRLRGVLAARPDHAAARLSARRNLAWVAGADTHVVRAGEGGVATLVVTAADAFVVTPVNEAARIAEEELGGLGLDVLAVPWENPDAVSRVIGDRVGGSFADDTELEGALRPLRTSLTSAEQDRLAVLGRDAARALTRIFEDARTGEREDVVAARLAAIMAEDRMAAPGPARRERRPHCPLPAPDPEAEADRGLPDGAWGSKTQIRSCGESRGTRG